MEERTGVVTMGGKPITLVGGELKEGDTATDAVLTDQGMQEFRPLAAAAGKTKLFVLVPSLDTPVCSVETKKFSDGVKSLGGNTAVYLVSPDLPFAQKRYCGAEGVDNITMLSDYRTMDLARGWGVYMKENGLHARAVFVLDANNRVTYREIVGEIANEPDYDAAFSALRNAAVAGA